MLALQYFDMSVQPYKNIIRCDNVTFDANSNSQYRYFAQYLTITFYASELDDDFIDAVTNRIDVCNSKHLPAACYQNLNNMI